MQVPLTRPSLGEAELDAVRRVFDSGWVAGQGPAGRRLEEGFAVLAGREHAVAVSSCTAGLHLVLQGLGIGPGDEVLVPDYTFPATAHAVLYTGATPRLVDVRATDGCIDVDRLEGAVTARTRAVVAVDCLGMPADWGRLASFADRRGLALVEDAACSTGGSFEGRPCGSFGQAAVFSLHARKGVTSGEGGVVVTDDAALAERVRRLSSFGMESARTREASTEIDIPVFTEVGYNYKLADILAAVGVVQLSRLDELLAGRAAAAARYAELLAGVPEITLPRAADGTIPTWQTYAVTVASGVPRDSLIAALRSQGVGCNIGTYSLSSQPLFSSSPANPVGQDLYHRHLALPMFSDISEAEQRYVADALVEALSRAPLAPAVR
jgi:dTDP-4-amino-4,6-dideoxygalactose transaminase